MRKCLREITDMQRAPGWTALYIQIPNPTILAILPLTNFQFVTLGKGKDMQIRMDFFLNPKNIIKIALKC